jgi:hypothetical protein
VTNLSGSSVHDLMARDATFYHQILRDVFKEENENPTQDEPDDSARARWRLSYSLIRNFSIIPGHANAEIDKEELQSWINTVLELGRGSDRISCDVLGT